MTSVIFTGDIGFDKYMAGRFADENVIQKEIYDFFKSADHVVANVEGALTESTNDGERGQFFHAMDPAATKLFVRMGADIWNISNNHCMDASLPGLINGQKIANELGVRTIGAGYNRYHAARPVYIREEGGIGMFACCYRTETERIATETEPGVLYWNDFDLIEQTIKDIKRTCKYCVLVIHGGEEFASMPIPYTRERYIRYLNMGADVIVAHHPHVVMNYESFPGGKMIFYSLGNFIFDTDYQRAQLNTDRGVLLKLNFDENGFTFDAMGTRVIRGEERVVCDELPDIFTEIGEREYNAMIPYACKAFLKCEKKRISFCAPKKYSLDMPQEKWDHYYQTARDHYIENEHNDFACYYDLSHQESDPDILPRVRDYLKAQM